MRADAQAVIRFMMPSPEWSGLSAVPRADARARSARPPCKLGGQAVGCSRPCGHALPFHLLVIEILGKRMDQGPGFVAVDLGEHIFARLVVILGLQHDRRRRPRGARGRGHTPVRDATVPTITTAAAIAIAGRLHRRHAMDHGPGKGSSAIDARTRADSRFQKNAGGSGTSNAAASLATARNSSNCVQAAQARGMRQTAGVERSLERVDKLVPVEMWPRRPLVGTTVAHRVFSCNSFFRFASAEEAGFHRADRAPEDPGDLVVRQIVIHAKDHRGALFFRQPRNRGANGGRLFLPQHLAIRQFSPDIHELALVEAWSSPASRTRD